MFLTLSQMTTDCQCCYCLLLSFHNNTTVTTVLAVPASDWSPGLHPRLSLVRPSLSWPLSSHLSASNVNTDGSKSSNIAQLNSS